MAKSSGRSDFNRDVRHRGLDHSGLSANNLLARQRYTLGTRPGSNVEQSNRPSKFSGSLVDEGSNRGIESTRAGCGYRSRAHDVQSGDVRAGIEQWETSLQIDPDDGNALNNLAWVLATFPADPIRDGKRAVELAEKATTLPGGNIPVVLRTLAAAYAEAGDFSKATNTAQRAIDLATAQNNSSLQATLRHELELYQARTPYRESPPQ